MFQNPVQSIRVIETDQSRLGAKSSAIR